MRVDGAGRHCLGDLVDGLFFFIIGKKIPVAMVL